MKGSSTGSGYQLIGKKKEYASKALGNYKPEFCRALAEDISKVKSVRAGKAMDLGPSLFPDPNHRMKGLVMAPTEKEKQDEEALGGMRNPAKSIGRLPTPKELGSVVRELIDTCLSKYPELKQTARDILERKEKITPLVPEVANKLKEATKKMLHADDLPEKTTVGETPLQADVIWGWGDNSDDPDAAVLATWLRIGALLGFDEHIKRTGIPEGGWKVGAH